MGRAQQSAIFAIAAMPTLHSAHADTPGLTQPENGSEAACPIGAFDPRTGPPAGPAPMPSRQSGAYVIACGAGGVPLVFLHGEPTSAFLWRDIAGPISIEHRIYAIDLVGFGRSTRPDIEYNFEDHQRFIDLALAEIPEPEFILVLHDWGSFFGLRYAMSAPQRIRGVVLLEPIILPGLRQTTEQSPLADIARDSLGILRALAGADDHEVASLAERFIQMNTVRTLSAEELGGYLAPLGDPVSRFAAQQLPRQIPRREAGEAIMAYSAWLADSQTPALLFYVEPGLIVGPSSIDWFRSNVQSGTVIRLGPGLHFFQEDYAPAIVQSMRDWLATLSVEPARPAEQPATRIERRCTRVRSGGATRTGTTLVCRNVEAPVEPERRE